MTLNITRASYTKYYLNFLNYNNYVYVFFMHISCKYRYAKRNAQDSVGLGKRPCGKIILKYVTPKISFLIECDDYRQKRFVGKEKLRGCHGADGKKKLDVCLFVNRCICVEKKTN